MDFVREAITLRSKPAAPVAGFAAAGPTASNPPNRIAAADRKLMSRFSTLIMFGRRDEAYAHRRTPFAAYQRPGGQSCRRHPQSRLGCRRPVFDHERGGTNARRAEGHGQQGHAPSGRAGSPHLSATRRHFHRPGTETSQTVQSADCLRAASRRRPLGHALGIPAVYRRHPQCNAGNQCSVHLRARERSARLHRGVDRGAAGAGAVCRRRCR